MKFLVDRKQPMAMIAPRLPYTGRAICRGRVSTSDMTRNDQMRDGYVARTFHIPEDLDEKLRLKAVKNKVRFSEITISALKEYLK